MRHRMGGYKLGRNTPHRKAMFRNMTIALFTHGQITTTIPKAKAVKPMIEKLITAAKKGDLASRRRVLKAIGDPILVDRDLKDFDRKELRADGYRVNKYHELQRGPRVVNKLFEEIAPQYADRDGGYTRIIKLAKHRIGDAAQLCVLQLVGHEADDAPQVSGSFSRRREKADKRMAYAAQLRKGKKGEAKTEAPAEVDAGAEEAATEPETDTATAVAEEPAAEESEATDEQKKDE